MPTAIKVTACDNELYIFASQASVALSYFISSPATAIRSATPSFWSPFYRKEPGKSR